MHLKKEKKGEEMAKWPPFLVTQRHLRAFVHVLLCKVITTVWSTWKSQYHTSVPSYLDVEQSFLVSQIVRFRGSFNGIVIRIGKMRSVSHVFCGIVPIFPNLPQEMWNDKALETRTGICYHVGLARHRNCRNRGLLFFSSALSFHICESTHPPAFMIFLKVKFCEVKLNNSGNLEIRDCIIPIIGDREQIYHFLRVFVYHVKR